MYIAAGVLSAIFLTAVFYASVNALDGKLSLHLRRKKGYITDIAVVTAASLTFTVWCVLGSRAESYLNLFETAQKYVFLLGISILAVTDAKRQIIPNRLLLILCAFWAAACAGGVIANPEQGIFMTGQSVIGAVTGGMIFLLCYLISKGQLGAGDVKLAFVMGLYLTGQRIIGAIVYGLVICCIYSLVQLARKKLTVHDGIPLVPFLYVGTLMTYIIL